jgi:hypothetical protein
MNETVPTNRAEYEEYEMDKACSTHVIEFRTKFWSGKLEGKRPLGRPRSRREGNIEVDLKEI